MTIENKKRHGKLCKAISDPVIRSVSAAAEKTIRRNSGCIRINFGGPYSEIKVTDHGVFKQVFLISKLMWKSVVGKPQEIWNITCSSIELRFVITWKSQYS